MGLFDLLGGNRSQMPGQAAQSPLQTLFDPAVMLPIASQLMGNQGNWQNFGNAFGVGGQALAQTRERNEQLAQQNRTLDFFRQNAPEFAQMIDAGMPVGEAWQTYTQQRFAKPPQGTDDMREYEFAKQQGYGGSFMDFQLDQRKAGATNVTVGGGKYGTIPPGYVLQEGPEGATMSPIPGGPAAREIEAGETATRAREDAETSRNSIVVQEIDRALATMGSDGLIPSTGFGSLLSGMPGTDAKALAARLDTIKANIGFAELNKMREQSPTGGALGQVTERELAFLQAVAGSLDQSQSAADLEFNLKRLRDAYIQVVNYGLDGPAGGVRRTKNNVEWSR